MTFIQNLMLPWRTFTPVELSVLNAVLGALPPAPKALMKRQIAAINRVDRHLDWTAVHFRCIRWGKVALPKECRFANVAEFELASVEFVAGNEAFRASLWSIGGHIFSLVTRPSIKSHCFAPVERIVVSLLGDPEDASVSRLDLGDYHPTSYLNYVESHEIDRQVNGWDVLPPGETYVIHLTEGDFVILASLAGDEYLLAPRTRGTNDIYHCFLGDEPKLVGDDFGKAVTRKSFEGFRPTGRLQGPEQPSDVRAHGLEDANTARPTHTVSLRPATDDERRVIKDQTKPDVFSYGCMIIIFGVAPIALLSMLGGWIASWFSRESIPMGRVIGALAGASIFVYALARLMPIGQSARRRAACDADAMVVQDIIVRDPRVWIVSHLAYNAPAVAFEIGEGKLLVLQGTWLVRDKSIYGAPPSNVDGDQDCLNGLAPPHSFPSNAFAISRLPQSGHVLSIRVLGDYLHPESEVEALKLEYEFGNSELFDGRLEQIVDVLAKEHYARCPEGKPDP